MRSPPVSDTVFKGLPVGRMIRVVCFRHKKVLHLQGQIATMIMYVLLLPLRAHMDCILLMLLFWYQMHTWGATLPPMLA